MSFLVQLQDAIFATVIPSHDEKYRFQVTEIYKDIQPVVYYISVADRHISFKKGDTGYALQVHGNPFAELDAKITALGCEAYIYPRFVKE